MRVSVRQAEHEAAPRPENAKSRYPAWDLLLQGRTLQKDAARYALLAAHTKAPTCAGPHIQTMTYDCPMTKPAQTIEKPWHGTWTIAVCGHVVRVGIKFIPDATGIQLAAEPASFAD